MYFTVTTSAGAAGRWVELVLENPVLALVNPIANTPIELNGEAQRIQLPIINLSPYPNPSVQEFSIEFELPESVIGQDVELYLIDQLGRPVHSQPIISDFTSLSALVQIPASINSGMYYLQLKSSEGIIGNGKVKIIR